ncbi:hypothetical protein SAMN04244567_02104 [Paracoccus pantotrophus]|nr:hypothetical protein SAMN04244567_02104 [Paracoccus pantotrophus]
MFGKATNDIVTNIIDRDTCATKPSRKMTRRGRVAFNRQRRISLSGKVGRELIDPRRQRSRIEEPVITIIGIHLCSPHDIEPSRGSIVMRSESLLSGYLGICKKALIYRSATPTPHNHGRRIVPEVHRLGRHQDPHALRRHQHPAAPRARTISASRTAGVSAASSSLTSPITIRICSSAGRLSQEGGAGAGSQTTSGAKTGASGAIAGSTSLPCLANRRHADSWFG